VYYAGLESCLGLWTRHSPHRNCLVNSWCHLYRNSRLDEIRDRAHSFLHSFCV